MKHNGTAVIPLLSGKSKSDNLLIMSVHICILSTNMHTVSYSIHVNIHLRPCSLPSVHKTILDKLPMSPFQGSDGHLQLDACTAAGERLHFVRSSECI